jgi:hypothetical protein
MGKEWFERFKEQKTALMVLIGLPLGIVAGYGGNP